MKQESIYTTRDLAAASYISYNDVKFAKPPYDHSIRSWTFQDIEKCEELDFNLRNGEALVEVIKYESVRRNLLGMVKDGREDSGRKHFSKRDSFNDSGKDD